MRDQRYDTPDYVYGAEPSRSLKRDAAFLNAGGRALAVADGEGCNSVFMAERQF
jgi:hypothetical protein